MATQSPVPAIVALLASDDPTGPSAPGKGVNYLHLTLVLLESLFKSHHPEEADTFAAIREHMQIKYKVAPLAIQSNPLPEACSE